jgi:predicted deacylase
MLAEIFMLRMEAVSRASKETAPAHNSRFVPITLTDFNAELPLEDECNKARGRPHCTLVQKAPHDYSM